MVHLLLAAALSLPVLHLVPRPATVAAVACQKTYAFGAPLKVAASFDAGAMTEINERWQALGLPALATSGDPDITVTLANLPAQSYQLDVDGASVNIVAGDADGAFYAAMTLAQLATRGANGGWYVPCVHIEDRPALRWRILSDDVSRGPLPTDAYFRERIRTIAAFKMNGYSPYMEHVFVSPTDPLPAPLDGITPAELHDLAVYAAQFHVTLIPEQQTFAHMHNTLKLETYAPMAELPHGYLLSPAVPESAAYLSRIIKQELAAIPNPPFFHIGADETATLGEGTTAAYVATHGGRSAVYANHINAMAALIAPSGARPMLWDDGIEGDPSIMARLPRNTVVVNWHYGNETSYVPYIQTIAAGGLDQMVAPGANNWNEIYPDLKHAIPNERLFINEGKAAHVLGLFQTVWHDDGETLYESTWYPVLYAAGDAWEADDVDPARFSADFPMAFFGVDDQNYGVDMDRLGDALARLDAAPHDTTNYLFWADPFNATIAARMSKVDLRAVRLDAEEVERHWIWSKTPLHAAAAREVFLAARRYDVLARAFQNAAEVRSYYADAVAHEKQPKGPSFRDLLWCKYWFWEMRDDYEELAKLYTTAWNDESRPAHLPSVLERFHMAAQRDIERADAIDRVTRETYDRSKVLPAFGTVIR